MAVFVREGEPAPERIVGYVGDRHQADCRMLHEKAGHVRTQMARDGPHPLLVDSPRNVADGRRAKPQAAALFYGDFKSLRHGFGRIARWRQAKFRRALAFFASQRLLKFNAELTQIKAGFDVALYLRIVLKLRRKPVEHDKVILGEFLRGIEELGHRTAIERCELRQLNGRYLSLPALDERDRGALQVELVGDGP